MKRMTVVATLVALLAAASHAYSQSPNHSFTLNAPSISGFPTGDISLTGGGTYDRLSGAIHAGGSFSAAQDVNQGPLAGLRAGEGIRWDTDQIVSTVDFKCSGAASEALKTSLTSDDTIVMQADFYRRGDGTNESFTAKMIVSSQDLDPLDPGIQNVWVQGVGCGEANVNFR